MLLSKKVYKCTTLKVQQQTMYYQFFNLIEYETQKFIFSNSGKLSLVPYTKDFGRITHF